MSTITDKIDIRTALPLRMECELGCPICGCRVWVTHAEGDSCITKIRYQCATEPVVIDGRHLDWMFGHYGKHLMPKWDAYTERVLVWINERYYIASNNQ